MGDNNRTEFVLLEKKTGDLYLAYWDGIIMTVYQCATRYTYPVETKKENYFLFLDRDRFHQRFEDLGDL